MMNSAGGLALAENALAAEANRTELAVAAAVISSQFPIFRKQEEKVEFFAPDFHYFQVELWGNQVAPYREELTFSCTEIARGA